MGNYSEYNLSIRKISDDTVWVDNEEIIKELRSEYPGASYCIDDYGDAYEDGKWYSADRDLRDFSKKYPEYMFELHKNDEEGFHTIFNVVNGKVQERKGQVVFPDIDENYLFS